jgi:hypothetical protein
LAVLAHQLSNSTPRTITKEQREKGQACYSNSTLSWPLIRIRGKIKTVPYIVHVLAQYTVLYLEQKDTMQAAPSYWQNFWIFYSTLTYNL